MAVRIGERPPLAGGNCSCAWTFDARAVNEFGFTWKDQMLKTRNDLAENTRGAMINLLQARLADALDLSTQTKQAHWNVKGPHFIGLHELFDEVHEHVDAAVDLIAERLVALGGIAEGTARVVAKRSDARRVPARHPGRHRPHRGCCARAVDIRQGHPQVDRRGRRSRRPGHRRPVHRGLAPSRQGSLDGRGPPPGGELIPAQPARRPSWPMVVPVTPDEGRRRHAGRGPFQPGRGGPRAASAPAALPQGPPRRS